MKLLVISLCTQGIMREHYIYYCREFAKYNELFCITNNNISNDELHAIETLNIYYNRKKPIGYFSVTKLCAMRSFINRVKPDVVYVFTHHASSILLAPIVRKYKLIYQVHDPVPHKGVGKLNAWIISIQLKIYSGIADKLIVAGEAVKRQVLENSKVKPDCIEVIPFAVLDDMIIEHPKTFTKNIDLLFYGRIEPYKGLDTLIQAIGLLEVKPETYIVGGGDLYKSYGNIKSLPDNVHLLGFLENKKLVGCINAAKIIVLPYHEATGTMTVCQAFYYGKPVIASDVGVLPEYVGNGGLIFEHGNAKQLAECILMLLNDEQIRKEFSENAKTLYNQKFTLEKACRAHQKVLESVQQCNRENVDFEDQNKKR